MITLFFGNRSYALLFLPFLIGGFYFCNFITQYHPAPEAINLGFWGAFTSDYNWALDILAPLLVFINAILINTLFNRNEFMEKNNFLSSLLYVTFLSFFPSFYHLDGVGLATTLLIAALIQTFRLYQNEDGRRAVFNTAILFGTAATLFPVLLVGIPALFMLIWIIRPFVLRESILLLSGIAIPLLYTSVYTYVFEIRMELKDFSSSSPDFKLLDAAVLASGIFLLGLASLKTVLARLRGSSIRLKKLFRMLSLLIWLYLGVSVLEFFIFHRLSALSVLFYPLVFYLMYAFGDRQPKGFASFIYYLLFLFAVGKFFFPFDRLAF